MLEGKKVRLRLGDKEDLDFFFSFWNNIDFYGEYEAIQPQISRAEAEKRIETSQQTGSGRQLDMVCDRKEGRHQNRIHHPRSIKPPTKPQNQGFNLFIGGHTV
jgi:hypothetical protein